MSCIKKYNGIIAFHPGCYVEEAIQDMKISQATFAKMLGIPEQILQELNVKRLTNAKFQHLDWEVKNINRELYIQAENNYHEKFKQVYGLEYECVCEVLSKIYCINRRVKKLAREEELRLAKLDRKNAHSVFDPFHVTHYHRDKKQGYRARRKRY